MKSSVLLVLITLAIAGCALKARNPKTPVVVVYTSVDQVFAEPVLKAFENKTGIKVLAVYDAEATKTTGLANRLIAEAARPRCDVFWNGEFVQTLRLKSKGVLAPYESPQASIIPASLKDKESYWTGLAPRVRVWMSSADFKPHPIAFEDLPGLNLPGSKIAMSDPLFGTASFQAAALYASKGPAEAGKIYEAIVRKGVRIVPGNSVVRDLVVAGQITLGLTDSDDACGAVRKGAKVHVFTPKTTWVFPSTVGLVKGGPNPESAKKFIDFLLSQEAEEILIKEGFTELPLHPNASKPCLNLPRPEAYEIDPQKLADHLEIAHRDLRDRLRK